MRVPAAVLAVPLLAGCAAGFALDVALVGRVPAGWAPAAAACACLAAIAAAGWLGDEPALRVAAAVALSAALSGLSLGLTAAGEVYRPTLLAWFEGLEAAAEPPPVVVRAVLREDAAATPYGAALSLAVLDVRAGTAPAHAIRGGARVIVGGALLAGHIDEWRAGRTVRLPVVLRLPSVYRNPGAPDERRGLARRGIVLVGSVKSASLVEVVAPGSAHSEAAAAIRAWVRRTLARHVGRRAPRSGGIATAILIGDRSGLDEEDARRLQEAGTYHVIAISGGNIAILTVLLLACCRASGMPPRAAAVVTIACLLFYLHLTGAEASVSRAVTAAVIYLAARIVDQHGPPLNIIAVAALAALAVSPAVGLDAGFVLSFGGTLGILVAAPPMAAALGPAAPTAGGRRERRGGVAHRGAQWMATAAAALLAATLAAELALAPASAALFSRITAAGVVVNFAAIPLMTVTQLSAMAVLAFDAVSPAAAGWAGAVTHAAAWGLVESARAVEVAPWLAPDVAPPAWWVLAAYYAACAALLAGVRPRVMLGTLVVLMGAVAWGVPLALHDAAPRRQGLLRVVVLDVGQGDATLVTLPDGRSLLVDAGGLAGSTFDMGRRVIAPALRVLGVRRLDELVITHGDPDHLGGALSLARAFRPRVIREGAPVPPHAGLRELAAHAAAAGIAWRTVQAGDADRLGEVTIRVLHPPLPDWERQRVRNDDSIVLEVRYRDVSIVLPGDIGRGPEQAIIPGLAAAPLVILKSPHHGSATSSSQPFVDALRPAAVIHSAGRHNRFGHPAAAVVRRYAGAGATQFGTDDDGAVIVETDGRQVEIRTMSGRVYRVRAR